MLDRTNRATMMLLLVGCMLGCGAPPEVTPTTGSRLHELDHDLVVGASGADVVALHEYLSNYGYFPNDELAARFPTWRSVVGALPDDPSVYDERTAEAVRGLQSRMGVPVTGSVDEATRDVLRQPRCGNPDGSAPDPSEKFAHHANSWGYPAPTLRWKVTNGGPVISATNTASAVQAALNTWAGATSLTFQQVTGSQTTDISIKWAALGDPDSCTTCPVADCQYPFPTRRTVELRFNSDADLSIATPTPTNHRDLQTIALHELGHCLGLYHSSVGAVSPTNSPVMYALTPVASQKRALREDDKQAISARYDQWESLSGQTRDIAINWFSNALTGAVSTSTWLLGNDTAPGGYNVYRWNGSSRELATGNRGATRIAVEHGGRPWIVDNAGNTYRRSGSSPSSGTWDQVPGCAQDIGISPASGGSVGVPTSSVHVWKIDCAQSGGGGGTVKKWDHGSANWVTANGAGKRIAVDGAGRPYVTDGFNNVWAGTDSTTSLGWTSHGCCGIDIAVSNSWIWLLGTNNGVYLRNQQLAGIGVDTPARDGWIYVNGAGTNIAADSNGRPYVGVDTSFWRVVK